MSPDQVIYDYAMSWLLRPYSFGGDDFTGIDCSGLCLELLKACGHAPPIDMSAQGLFEYFKEGSIRDFKRFGSLAFYGKSETKISHVGFCLNEVLLIEAGGGTSRTIDERQASRDNAFVRIRPITGRSDLVSVLRPVYTRIGESI